MTLALKTNQRKDRSAFSMIDALVGMGVLGIVLLSLFAAFTFGFSVVKLSRDELRATQILQEKMEAIRLYNWDQVAKQTNFIKATFTAPLGTNGPVYFSGQIEIQPPINPAYILEPVLENYADDLRQITVTLTWTNNNLKRTRQTSTFVSHNGLQNYVP